MATCPRCKSESPDGQEFCGHCGQMLPAAVPTSSDALSVRETQPFVSAGLTAGDVLRERYQLDRVLGRGGMGVVWLARDLTLDLPMAVKVVSDLLARDAAAMTRLRDEARISIGLSHSNIVSVKHFEDEGPIPFVVMEYVDGESLASRIARERRLAEPEVRRIGVALCEALGHAHLHQVLHRDVKPANVLLGAGGVVKLADFGIARVARDSVSRLTNVVTSGTLLYMSPEQVRGKPGTAASDLYSLGALLYELVAGDAPFHSGDLTFQVLNEPPEPLAACSAELNATILRLLAKTAEERFASAAEVCAELDGSSARGRAGVERQRRDQEQQARGAQDRAAVERRRVEDERRVEEARRREAERRRADTAAERTDAEALGPERAASRAGQPDAVRLTVRGSLTMEAASLALLFLILPLARERPISTTIGLLSALGFGIAGAAGAYATTRDRTVRTRFTVACSVLGGFQLLTDPFLRGGFPGIWEFLLLVPCGALLMFVRPSTLSRLVWSAVGGGCLSWGVSRLLAEVVANTVLSSSGLLYVVGARIAVTPILASPLAGAWLGFCWARYLRHSAGPRPASP